MIGKHINYFKLDVLYVPETTIIKRKQANKQIKHASLMLPHTVGIHSEDLPIGQVCGYDGRKERTNPTPGEIERKKGNTIIII